MLLSQYTEDKIEAGTDEAGRGCLAGPVFAAAVILPKEFTHPFLRDSKKLNSIQREELEKIIKAEAVDYAVKKITPKKIDQINILNASILAMHKSLAALRVNPEFILVDGNRFKPFKKIPFECIIKGDDKFYSIAAASILAKVGRDRYMRRMAKKFPFYSWETNMGYPTKAHRASIETHGITPLHRLTFKLLDKTNQLDLFDSFDNR
ncbi:MAG: ribonuclease HII [Saprospiraceae bacterium]|nr:ribonuclease HII [Bacteroidia bacterium]NNE16686.1 ribonuclease HII [Saprospiraceae bacterium]NNL93707.1 ribonuclease HII [Saprospiraceae bacterium]